MTTMAARFGSFRRGADFLPPVERLQPLGLTFDLQIMGVINQDDVTTNAEQGAASRCGYARAALAGVEAALRVLVQRNLEPLAPAFLIPGA